MSPISASDSLRYLTLGELPSNLSVVVPSRQHNTQPPVSRRKPTPHGTDYAKFYQQQDRSRFVWANFCNQNVGQDTAAKSETVNEEKDPVNNICVSNEVFAHYNLNNRDPVSFLLPVHKKRTEIVNYIDTYPVVIIEGNTGCGKSTQVPQFILDHSAACDRRVNIIVTQPRRIAARSIAKRVSSERNWPLGTLVGYEIGHDRRVSLDTRITFCTAGVLLERLVSRSLSLTKYTHIVIDEVHERSVETDMLILLLRKCLRLSMSAGCDAGGVGMFKLVLMSATFDTRLFADYFSLRLSMTESHPAPVLSLTPKSVAPARHGPSRNFHTNAIQTDRRFQIQMIYLETVIGDLNYGGSIQTLLTKFGTTTPGIAHDLYQLTVSLITALDRIDTDVEDRSAHVCRGSVLVFVPGIREMETLSDLLDANKVANRWRIYHLHSMLPSDEQMSVYDEVDRQERKVILSTNVAESSITLSDARYVVDFCLTKRLQAADMILGCSGSCSSLQLEWACQSSCEQRAGRVGRTSHGRVYRMVPRDFYENTFERYEPPEMSRIPLTDVILRVKRFAESTNPKCLLALALQPPPLERIHHAILSLIEMGALTRGCGSAGASRNGALLFHSEPTNTTDLDDSLYCGGLTLLGVIMGAVPMAASLGRMLGLAHALGCLSECIIICAALKTQTGLILQLYNQELDAYRFARLWAAGSQSDALAYLNVYRTWQRVAMQGAAGGMEGRSERAWCRRNHVNYQSLREVCVEVDEITDRLARVGVTAVARCDVTGAGTAQSLIARQLMISDEQVLMIKICLAGALYPNYFVPAFEPVDSWRREAERMLDGHEPNLTVMVRDLPREYAPLYRGQLQRLFTFQNSCVPDVFVSANRAYIRYPVEGGNKSRSISESVYLALRRGHGRNKVFIRRFKSDMEEKLIKEYKVLNSIKHKSKPNHLRKQFPAPFLPTFRRQEISIFVSHVESLDVFYARYMTQYWQLQYEIIQRLIESRMQGHTQAATSRNPNCRIQAGDAYLVQYERNYYRCRLVSISGQTYKVFLVDVGKHVEVRLDDIYPVESERSDQQTVCRRLFQVPALAVTFRLRGVRPFTETYARWDEDTVTMFSSLVLDKICAATIYSVVAATVVVDLEYLPHLSVTDRLAKCRLIEFCSEGYMSRRNHETRHNAQVHSSRTKESTDEFQAPDSSQTEGQPDQEMEDFLSRLSLEPGGGPAHTVSCAHSPLLLSVHAITHSLRGRSVCVAGNSCNTVLLDTNPGVHDPPDTDGASSSQRPPAYPRPTLMVAYDMRVGQNARATVQISNTTLMPSVGGITSLMVLLFAPHVQMHVHRAGGYYTALTAQLMNFRALDKCSNSAASTRLDPMFRQHSIEIDLDVEISTSDLETVNMFRTLFWDVYGAPAHLSEYRLPDSERNVVDKQEKLKTCVRRLLQPCRRPIAQLGAVSGVSADRAAYKQTVERSVIDDTDLARSVLPACFDSRIQDYLVDGSYRVQDMEYTRIRHQMAALRDQCAETQQSALEAAYCPVCREYMMSNTLQRHLEESGHRRLEADLL